MKPIDAMDALTRIERPATFDGARGPCIGMFVAPALLAAIVAGITHMRGVPSAIPMIAVASALGVQRGMAPQSPSPPGGKEQAP
jgi:hypothetical protein